MRAKPFPSSFFTKNRQALREALPDGSLGLIFSGEEQVRNHDQKHPFRVDSNFFYLTGLETPGAMLILLPESAGKQGEKIYIPPVDLTKEQWEGKMLGLAEATKLSGCKSIFLTTDFEQHLFGLQKEAEVLYTEVNQVFAKGHISSFQVFLRDLNLRLPHLQIKKIDPFIVPLRAKKQKPEINRIKESLGIIERAYGRVSSVLSPNLFEYQIEAEIARQYLWEGCDRLGFDTIVAGGKNAATLHYVTNHCKLKKQDMVLIDTGGEYGMYSGDITRVFPVSGKFTAKQKKYYQAVLEVNKEMTDWVQAGFSWKEVAEKASYVQGQVYKKAKIIKDSTEHQKVSLHRIGHSLGLDVHDLQKADSILPINAVITIEPGLYLPNEGIGIRIEDDVLLNERGCEVLSKGIPKEIKDLEEMMGN
ncbi:MAG: aminopeptidase P N-terminal domain-containing protein [SAR324 cluster bacterium]|nr:aminopeptidase P N-terminal domain-containing protein [SAR324 cluster bacterium]